MISAAVTVLISVELVTTEHLKERKKLLTHACQPCNKKAAPTLVRANLCRNSNSHPHIHVLHWRDAASIEMCALWRDSQFCQGDVSCFQEEFMSFISFSQKCDGLYSPWIKRSRRYFGVKCHVFANLKRFCPCFIYRPSQCLCQNYKFNDCRNANQHLYVFFSSCVLAVVHKSYQIYFRETHTQTHTQCKMFSSVQWQY